MTSRRTKHWSSVAVLIALLVTLGGLVAAPAQALTARSISTTATPTSAYAGTAVTFTGRVTRSPIGTLVRVQRRAGTAWVNVATTRTVNSRGAYKARVTLPSNAAVYTFRAASPATRKLARTRSSAVAVTALRHTTATLTASPASVDAGDSSTLSGSVSPYVANTTVTVQRLVGGAWTNVASTPVTSNGTFSKAVSPSTTSSYRVYVPRAGLNGSTISPTHTVTVVPAPPPPTITTNSLPDAVRAEAYAVTLTHTGGAGAWKVEGLPAELTYDASTGVISGVPKEIQQYAVLVTFTETASNAKVQKLFSLEVGGVPLRIGNDDLPEATRGVAYTVTMATTGKPGTWEALGLPDGLTINASTGVISGTPLDDAGTYPVFVTYHETITADSTQKGYALVLHPNPVVTTTSLPDGTTGTAYSQQLTRTSAGAGTWAVTKGELPPGIALSADGLLSGTPTQADDWGFTVTFTETASGLSDSQALLLHVSSPGAPVITTASLPDSTIGTPYSATLAATPTGGVWTVTFGDLPPGLSLDALTGEISGTPTTAGAYIFQVTYSHLSAQQTKVFQIRTFPAS